MSLCFVLFYTESQLMFAGYNWNQNQLCLSFDDLDEFRLLWWSQPSDARLDRSIGLHQLMNMIEFGSCGYVSHVTSTQHANNYILMLLHSQWLHFYSNRYVICIVAIEKSQTSRVHVKLAISSFILRNCVYIWAIHVINITREFYLLYIRNYLC